MLFTIFDQISGQIFLYLACLPFYGIIGFSSLNFFAVVSKSNEDNLRQFLDELRFPYTIFIKVYYGKSQEQAIRDILSYKRGMSTFGRILGSIMPIIYICSLTLNLLHHNPSYIQNITSIIMIFTSIITLIVFWLFGSKLYRIHR